LNELSEMQTETPPDFPGYVLKLSWLCCWKIIVMFSNFHNYKLGRT